MRKTWLLPLLQGTPAALAALHHLFVGNLNSPARIYSLEFDDEVNTLRIAQNLTADAPLAWIAFSHDKKNVYGASIRQPRLSSYAVINSTHLSLTRNITASGACFNKTSAFVLQSPNPPYHVISGAWPGPEPCGMTLSVDETGALEGVVDSWLYANESGIHGLALGEKDGMEMLYSADLNGNSVWTHGIDAEGQARELGRWRMKGPEVHPRHLAIHPNGRHLYGVMEAGNAVVEFELDAKTGLPVSEVGSYSVVPPDEPVKDFWSAEILLSPSARYLWATARSHNNTEPAKPGYISAYLLSSSGSIVKKMFTVPTTTLQGQANAIVPAFWSDEYAAMTDWSAEGYVQVWRMRGGRETAEGDGVLEYESASAVAKVGIVDGGCCANAIWLD